MSNSLQPHGLQPTRLLHPWDFPGKSTGVGCHCLLWLRALWWPKCEGNPKKEGDTCICVAGTLCCTLESNYSPIKKIKINLTLEDLKKEKVSQGGRAKREKTMLSLSAGTRKGRHGLLRAAVCRLQQGLGLWDECLHVGHRLLLLSSGHCQPTQPLLVEDGDSKHCDSADWRSMDIYLIHRGFHSQSPRDYIRSFLKAEKSLQD